MSGTLANDLGRLPMVIPWNWSEYSVTAWVQLGIRTTLPLSSHDTGRKKFLGNSGLAAWRKSVSARLMSWRRLHAGWLSSEGDESESWLAAAIRSRKGGWLS